MLHFVSYALIFVGAINWGLIGLLGFNLVNTVFATIPMLEGLTYVLVGASAVYLMTNHKSYCKYCSEMMKK